MDTGSLWLSAIFLSLLQWSTVAASCYFPQEFQGDYDMQSSAIVGLGIQYSTLNITENSISVWGTCHRRIGSNFILMVNFSETSCMRCLNLKLRSASVLQVFASSQETISKCFTNEETAEANCPSKESLSRRESAEILLFKVRDNQGSYVQKQYCPIDGKYVMNYKGKNPLRPHECTGFSSTVDSCPSGSTLNFRLRSCSFDSYDLKLECLGHWDGQNGEKYLVFTDSRSMDGQKPRYRCALYKEDHWSGKISMAVSRDSTCTTDLYNSTSGFEIFSLSKKSDSPWPLEVSSGICSFPKWMNGDWEYVKVHGDTMIYKDHSSFKTYTIKCMGVLEDSNKYLIFSRSQCDEETYNCMRISNRSNNIFEMQIGTNNKSTSNKDVFVLCAEENFDNNSWITQGRTNVASNVQPGLCPITGNYTGVIPDAPELCAMLWSDCRAPELMYYQVSHCESQEVYEEREYQCLGHWREANLLYTYTERRDVADGTYECFVGSIISDNDIYIKEAGEHCQRNIDPLRHGMRLRKTQPLYSCVDRGSTVSPKRRPTTLPSVPSHTSVHTPRWTTYDPIDTNNIPDESNEGKSSSSNTPNSLSLLVYIFVFIYYLCI